MRIGLCGCVALLAFQCVFGGGEATAGDGVESRTESRAEARRRVLDRPRWIMVDNDGMDAINFPKDLPATAENFWNRRLAALPGAGVDTVCYTPFANSFMLSTPSKATEVYTGPPNQPERFRNIVAELHQQGTDPLELAIRFCREHKLGIFASLRVNDCHDTFMPRLFPRFKKEQPHLLLRAAGGETLNGAGTGLDFTHPEVRGRFVGMVREMLAYDIDGLILDFMRFPILFPTTNQGLAATDAERGLLTDMMRRIRAEVDAAGDARGRFLPLAVRVHESAALCYFSAMDIERWLKEGWIDLLIAGSDRERCDTSRAMIALAQAHGAKAYASIDHSWMKTAAPFRRDFGAAAAQAMAAAFEGADGLYLFNYINTPAELESVKRLAGGPQALAAFDKDYYLQYNINTLRFHDDRDFRRIPDLAGYAVRLEYGGEVVFSLEVGDDFSAAEVKRRFPEIRLNINCDGIADLPLAASINGTTLSPAPAARPDLHSFAVPPEALARWENSITLSLPADAAQPLAVLRGDKLLVHGRNQAPWRRYYRAHHPKSAERIVDGAYRIADTGTRDVEMANLFYPLPVPSTGPLTVSFELRVESSTAPEAVALRLGDGENVELVSFAPGRIGFEYGGTGVPFTTDDDFHAYTLRLEDGRLHLTADGRELLAGEAVSVAAETPAARLASTASTPPPAGLHRGFFLGSLSGPGTGAARWRNVTLQGVGVPVNDLGLSVRFSAPAP